MSIRYYFVPLLQLETPIFEKLARAIVDGLYAYTMFPTFGSRLFLARRLVGVPGYQLNLDGSKEYFIRQIFTADELKLIKENCQNVPGFEYLRNFLFDEKIRVLDINRQRKEKVAPLEPLDDDFKSLMDILELKHPNQLKIIDLDDTNYQKNLNDRKFYELSFKDRFLVKFNLDFVRRHQNRFIKSIHDAGVGAMLFVMKKHAKFAYNIS